MQLFFILAVVISDAMIKYIYLLALLLFSFDSFSQNYWDYHLNGKKKSEGDTLDGMKQGLWREFDENGMLKTAGIYWEDKKYGYWLTSTPAEKISKLEFYDNDVVFDEFRFYETITLDNLKFMGEFELEIFRLRKEVVFADKSGDFYNIRHVPSHIPGLENTFQNLIKEYGDRIRIFYGLVLYHKQWYIDHFRENYFDCEFFIRDSRGRVLENRRFKNGIEEFCVRTEYYIGKKSYIYEQWRIEDEKLKSVKIFLRKSDDTYKLTEYYDYGKIKSEGNITKGIKTGKWKYYDENGKLINSENY